MSAVAIIGENLIPFTDRYIHDDSPLQTRLRSRPCRTPVRARSFFRYLRSGRGGSTFHIQRSRTTNRRSRYEQRRGYRMSRRRCGAVIVCIRVRGSVLPGDDIVLSEEAVHLNGHHGVLSSLQL